MRKSLTKLSKENLIWAALFTLLTCFINGFEGARGVDVKIIKYCQDPTLFQNDPYIQSIIKTPYILAYQPIVYLTKIFNFISFETLLLLIYLVVTFLIFLILAEIVKTLFSSRKVTFLFLFLFILDFKLFQLGSTTLHRIEDHPYLTSYLMARVFQLGSLLFLLKERYFLATSLAGFAFNFHALNSLYLAVILALFFLFNLNKFKIKALFLWTFSFFLFSLPTFFALARLPRVNFVLDEKNFLVARYLTRGLSTFLHFPPASAIFATIGFSLFLVALKKFPSKGNHFTQTIIIAVLLMVFASFILVDILKLPFALSFLFLRASFYIDLFGLAYLVNYLVRAWNKERLPKSIILLIIFSMTFALYRLFALLALLILLIEAIAILTKKFQKLAKNMVSFSFISALAILLIIYTLAPASLPDFIKNRLDWEKPKFGYQIQAGTRDKEWKYVRLWSNTTPKNSLFLILVRDEGFGTYSERAEIRLGETSGNLLFDPQFAQTYIAQMEDLGFNFEEMTEKNNITVQEERVYNQISEEKLIDFSLRYGIDYLVISRQRKLNLPLVFQNNFFSVYQPIKKQA